MPGFWHGRASRAETDAPRGRLEDTEADKVAATVAARATGTCIRRIAREFRVEVGTVLRLTNEAAIPGTSSTV
jgi:hypothetical protein